jgi:hypothetical protein
MSYFLDPAGQRHALFGEGGGIAMAEQLGTVLLGQVPLIADIRAGGDSGRPDHRRRPASAAAGIFPRHRPGPVGPPRGASCPGGVKFLQHCRH